MIKGDTFENPFTVSKETHAGFIDLFGDRNPLHTNAAFSKEHGFRDVVMHGNILGGFISYFIGECIPFKNVIIHSQEIKYVSPVYLEDQLMLICEVVDVFESVGVIELKFNFVRKNTSLQVAKGRIQIGILK